MTNPYEPPSTSETATRTERRFYDSGFWPIAILGIVIGGAVGGLINGYQNGNAVLVFPAVGWMGATVLLILMIRDSRLTLKGKVLFAFLLPIPAYILYVPVCVVSSICTMPFLGQIEYGPSTAGLIVASAFAFFLVLMLTAVVVRANYQVRDEQAPKPLDE